MNGRSAGAGSFHTYYLDGYREAVGEPDAVREALGRYRLLSKGPVFVRPGELIVGAHFRSTSHEPLVNRVSAHYVQRHVLDEVGRADPTARERLGKDIDAIGDTIIDRMFPATYSEEERRASDSGIALCCHFNGHMALDYGRLLSRGVGGLRDDVQRFSARAATRAQREFYRAMTITLDAIEAFVARHADEAERQAAAAPGEERERSERAAAVCRSVATNAPRTLHEALQLLWFGMMLGDYDSFGRFDQYAYPFYAADLAVGPSPGWADDLLVALWQKIEEHGAIINMTIGGVHPDGTDGTNPLTYLALRTTRGLGMKSPNLCLRIRHDSPRELWEEAHRGLATGQSLPALYNEARIIATLQDAGIPLEDARDFCLAGCSQVIIPGKSTFGCDMGAFNALKILELALHDGVDPRTGVRVGPSTGRPDALDSFEAVRDAWRAQMRHAVRIGASICNKDSVARRDFCSTFRSLLTSDCLERGAGIFSGGARYAAIQSEIVGLTNVANALAALRKVVFQEKAIGLPALVQIMDEDYAGNEELRLRLQNGAPKFGNHDAGVDTLRAEITSEFYEELRGYPAEPGGFHWPGEVIFSYHVDLAPVVGASADGRHAGAPLADSAGASQGTDLNGPTALLASMLALPQGRALTCCSLNLRFTPTLWTAARGEIVSLLRSYFERGGYQVQINVVDARTLEAARRDPSSYRSLVVRVGGFSAYFTQLEPALQQEIIGRTAHGAI